MEKCFLCPVRCGADRSVRRGACGADNNIRIGAVMNHFGEEPPLVGKKGSGAVFFSGCPLHCVFCQNADISVGGEGKIYSPEELEETLLTLNEQAENINLVTAGHYLDCILPVLEKVKPRLTVPVVYNTGGYETTDAIKRLDGIVDVYLPDFKYYSSELSQKYTRRADYREVAIALIDEAVRQQGETVIENGLMKRGVMIRHLVLPNSRDDSIKIVETVAERWKDHALISLMSQYTPSFNRSDFPELDRKVTSFEYGSVLSRAEQLGLNGFFQSRASATNELTPVFKKE